MPKPIEIFFSYAHEDEQLMDDVRRQLVIFDRQKIISKWHDRKILPGADLNGVIDVRIKGAEVILLFVSPHFLESKYCYNIEMAEAMKRHGEGSATVIPIIIRHCLWQTAPFAGLLALPTDGRPLAAWPDRDEACMNVAKGIMDVVTELRDKKAKGSTSAKFCSFKLIIINSSDAYKTVFSGEPVEWSKLITAIISNPSFPKKLREAIDVDGLAAYELIDLENKETIETPNISSEVDAKLLGLVHKNFLDDLSVTLKADLLVQTYCKD